MSLTSGPINEGEQAGEKLADHIGANAPVVFGQVATALLALLDQRVIVIRISLENK